MGRLLDEDTVIKVLERWQKAFRENSHYVSASDLSLVVKDVRELPPAQPERETVKCIIGGSCMDIGDADFSMKCAKCGAEYYHVEDYDYDYNFCPNCGQRWRRQDGH